MVDLTLEQKRQQAIILQKALRAKRQAETLRGAQQEATQQPRLSIDEQIAEYSALSPEERTVREIPAFERIGVTRKPEEGRYRQYMLGLREAKEGAWQLGMDVLEQLGILDEGSTNRFTKLTVEELAQLDEELKAEFGDSIDLGISRFAGQVSPFVMIGGGRGSFMQRSAKGGVTAGGVAGLQLVAGETPEERAQQRAQNFSMGAPLGVLGASVGELGRLRNFLSRTLARGFAQRSATQDRLARLDPTDPNLTPFQRNAVRQAQAEAQGVAFAREGVEITQQTGVPLNLYQLTGDPWAEQAVNIARTAASGQRMDRFVKNEQIRRTFEFWQDTLSRLGARAGVQPLGPAVRGAFETTMGNSRSGAGLLGARKVQAMADFQKVADITGDDAFIPLANFHRALGELIEQNTSRGASPAQKRFASQLQAIKDDFTVTSREVPSVLVSEAGEAITTRQKAGRADATAMEIQNMLANWGDEASGTGRIFADIENSRSLGPAKKVFAALASDLDEAVSGSSPAALALREARDNYRINSLPIQRVRQSMLGRLFGRRDALDVVTDDDIIAAFHNARPDSIREAMDILEEAAPDLKLKLQRQFIEDKMEQALAEGPAFGPRTGEFAVPRFSAGRMFELRKDPRFNAVFTDPEVLARIEAVSAVTERVFLDAAQRPASGGLPRLKEAMGVAASRDPTFMARLFGELFAPNVLKRALTPEGAMDFAEAAAKEIPFPANRISAVLAEAQAEIDKEMGR